MAKAVTAKGEPQEFGITRDEAQLLHEALGNKVQVACAELMRTFGHPTTDGDFEGHLWFNVSLARKEISALDALMKRREALIEYIGNPDD